jgi:sugar/nucleoside kinase (ribokinase family)
MAEVAVFGTAAADVIVQVPRLPGPGDHLSATSLGWRLGGGSANLACALAAADHRVEFVGPFGNDPMANLLLAEIERYGVGTGRSFRAEAPTPRALILLDQSGERTILGLDQEFTTDVYPLLDAPEVGTVDGVYVETYVRFPTAIADRAPDALLVLTPPAASAAHWPADIVVGSERQYPSGWSEAPFEAARAIVGPRLRWVVVTRGPQGADAYGPHHSVHVDARPARQVDATGAGDAFAAGLMSMLLTGCDIGEAMHAAAEAGAAAVEVIQSVPASAIEALGVTWPGSG